MVRLAAEGQADLPPPRHLGLADLETKLVAAVGHMPPGRPGHDGILLHARRRLRSDRPLMVRDTPKTNALVAHLREHGVIATGWRASRGSDPGGERASPAPTG